MHANRLKKFLLRMQAFFLCAALMLALLPSETVFALDNKDQTANADIVRTLNLSYQLKGQDGWTDLAAPYKIDDITKLESLHANYSFELKDHIDDATGAVSRTVTAGDYYLIDLPEDLIVSHPESGSILGNNNRPIADYSFVEESPNNWKIKIVFTDYVDDPNEYEIHGHMEFDFTLDTSAIGEGTTQTVYIPIDNTTGVSIDVTNPVPPSTKPVSLTKTVASYDDQTRELVWNVKMEPETGVFSGCVFTDTLDTDRMDLISIRHGPVTLVEGTDYTYDPHTGKIVYTIPNGRDGKDYQNIVLTTAVKRSVYGSLSPTTIANQANLSGGDSFVDIDSNTASKTITPDWFGKSGTLFEGNKIQWTLTANTTRQSMYNAVITDNFQADVKLEKNTVRLGDGTAVPVYDGAHPSAGDTEIYGVYTENPDGTSVLKIYLPRNKANASNAAQIITFVTDVVSPDTAVAADPVYNNTATLEANYVTDGDGEGTLPAINLGQVGVAVPYISVVKSHQAISAEDKRDGTITWTITAASNLSDYGKSTIVDTLPEDQDYLADEIYWGSQRIVVDDPNPTSDPRAHISADGRTLTITFNTFEALQTQQTFTVKTKIRQDVYGQNLSNRTFTNSVRGALLSPLDENTELASDTDTDSVSVTNTVIAKSSSRYNQNTTGQGQNPRVNFTIAINGNLMPLSDVVVTDDLSKIVTEFKKSDGTAWSAVDGAKWTYVPGTLSISRSAGSRDSHLTPAAIAAIAAGATYTGDVLTVDFGSGVPVNDKYTISFTAELDVSQNDIFKENGTIRCRGNTAEVEATGLKAGLIDSPSTGNQEVTNQVLNKTGIPNADAQQVVWTIRLNQHRVVLDNPRVVDVLPLGLTLDPTSIKLYTGVIGADGNFIADSAVGTAGTPVDFAYTYLPAEEAGMEGRYVITVNLPDNQTDYILRFATDVDQSVWESPYPTALITRAKRRSRKTPTPVR